MIYELSDIELKKNKKPNEKGLPGLPGLYESYYFRGNDEAGKISFWLKHNLIRFKGESQVRVDNILIIYNYDSSSLPGEPLIYQQSKTFSEKEFATITEHINRWNEFSCDFFSITENKLKGHIGEVSWDLEYGAEAEKGGAFYHFNHPWFYRGFFPKKKILTVNSHLVFKGRIGSYSGTFIGMNGHNWGREHAYLYSYANCNQFKAQDGSPVEAYFDGFSAKIKIKNWVSPYLSSAGLYFNGKWFYWNNVLTSWRHQVEVLSAREWHVVFEHKEARLHVVISGKGSHSTWASLLYDHPNKQQSMVENTKTARGRFEFVDRRSKQSFVFFSSCIELESLIPRDLID